MLFTRPRYLRAVLDEAPEASDSILEALATKELLVKPVFECVKVWCTVGGSGVPLYARHKDDILEAGRLPSEIVENFKNDAIRAEVFDMLCEASEAIYENWPFFEGSSSWILLELLSPVFSSKAQPNKRTIILREASRMSYFRGPVKSKLSESVFSRMIPSFESQTIAFMKRPSGFLKNCSGSGFLTESRLKLSQNMGKVDQFCYDNFCEGLMVQNKGVFLRLCGEISESVQDLSLIGVDCEYNGETVRIPLSFASLSEEITHVKKKDYDLELPAIWRE